MGIFWFSGVCGCARSGLSNTGPGEQGVYCKERWRRAVDWGQERKKLETAVCPSPWPGDLDTTEVRQSEPLTSVTRQLTTCLPRALRESLSH